LDVDCEETASSSYLEDFEREMAFSSDDSCFGHNDSDNEEGGQSPKADDPDSQPSGPEVLVNVEWLDVILNTLAGLESKYVSIHEAVKNHSHQRRVMSKRGTRGTRLTPLEVSTLLR
jgi:hypothetical protein